MSHDDYCNHCENSTCLNCDKKAEYGLKHDGIRHLCDCGGYAF